TSDYKSLRNENEIDFYLREGNFRRGTRICYAITLCFVMRLIRLRAKTAPQDSNADFEEGAECLINFAAESSLEQCFAQLVADSLFFPLLAPFPRLFARAPRFPLLSRGSLSLVIQPLQFHYFITRDSAFAPMRNLRANRLWRCWFTDAAGQRFNAAAEILRQDGFKFRQRARNVLLARRARRSRFEPHRVFPLFRVRDSLLRAAVSGIRCASLSRNLRASCAKIVEEIERLPR